jgi:hypothetical protein
MNKETPRHYTFNEVICVLSIALLIGGIAGRIISYSWGFNEGVSKMQVDAVRMGVANFNPQTGHWQWITNSVK